MKTNNFTCDCGCAKETSSPKGWLHLSQIEKPRSDIDPKIEELHFSSFECLNTWTKNALIAIPSMQKTASSLSPRGTFVSEKAKGLYV